MTTVSDVISAALRGIGALEGGQTADTDQLADGLEYLNNLLTNLSEDELVIPSRTKETLTISASQASYTIGSSGDFDTDWPLSIEHAFFRENGVDFPIDVVGARRYLDIYDKYTSGSPAHALYYEPSYPLGKIYFSTQPLTTYDFILTTLKPISEFAATDDTISLRPGYKRFLIWNLAVEMASQYGQGDVSLAFKHAEDSKDAIERTAFHSHTDELVVDNGIAARSSSGYDINRGPV